MPKKSFHYRLFFILLVVFSATTFYTANTISVTKYTTANDPLDTLGPLPVVIALPGNLLQVVTPQQLVKLQLPDPETKQKLKPRFLLDDSFFNAGKMARKSLIGTSISNGNAIHIPSNYSAQISAIQLDDTSQEITVTYISGAEEDQLITSIYMAGLNQYTPRIKYVKNVLIWKSIFMNGMMLSLVAAFLIAQRFRKKTAH